MRLDRRWWLAIGVAVVVAVVVVLSNTVFDGPSEECKPVKDMLDFNNSQGELIASKASDSDPAVPTVAEDAAYQQWADGMAQRAQQVTDRTWRPRPFRSPMRPVSSSPNCPGCDPKRKPRAGRTRAAGV